MGYSPWGHKESDTAEQRTLSFSCFEMMLFETMYPGVTLCRAEGPILSI